jgi:hypothetical protein
MLLTVGGVFVFVYSTDKQVVVLKDGSIKTVDEIWESGTSIFYEVDGDIFLLNQDEIKSYGKRNVGHIFQGVTVYFSKRFEETETNFYRFLKKNNITPGLSPMQYVFLLGLLLFLLIFLFTRRSVKKLPEESPVQAEETVTVPEVKEGVPTRIDVVEFFLNLYRKQIGAEPDAPTEYVALMSKNSGPNHIYELRVKHMEDWAKRRMTIGPLGEESGSKSKCYYVIYDVHMVVKIPAKPVTDFEPYIESIKKETHIVNKLIPKECIIPKVSVILGMFHSFSNADNMPPDHLEE